VQIDIAARRVRRSGVPVPLRPKDYTLLLALLRRCGRVVTRAELLREVWGYADDVESRTIDTHVARLRRLLERDSAHPRHIITVRPMGYRLDL
jgi:DNA-binding response OmpR family regulator